jgi:hypothetical protein
LIRDDRRLRVKAPATTGAFSIGEVLEDDANAEAAKTTPMTHDDISIRAFAVAHNS